MIQRAPAPIATPHAAPIAISRSMPSATSHRLGASLLRSRR